MVRKGDKAIFILENKSVLATVSFKQSIKHVPHYQTDKGYFVRPRRVIKFIKRSD